MGFDFVKFVTIFSIKVNAHFVILEHHLGLIGVLPEGGTLKPVRIKEPNSLLSVRRFIQVGKLFRSHLDWGGGVGQLEDLNKLAASQERKKNLELLTEAGELL